MAATTNPATRPRPASFAPATPGQYYVFVGSLTDGQKTASFSFSVLAGAGAATMTGGGAKWGVVDRPQRKGLTILQGYDPVTLVIPVLFDAVTADYADRAAGHPNRAAGELEKSIQKLLWMTGRGLLYNDDGGVGKPAQGDSPLVQVFSSDGSGNEVPLVPRDFQTPNLYWVLNDPGFDSGPLRNADGYRVRQAATITLTEHVASQFQSSADSPRTRSEGRNALTGKYLWVNVQPSLNTVAKLAWHYAHTNAWGDWQEIIAANPGAPGSPKAPITRLKKIRIPQAIVKHIASG